MKTRWLCIVLLALLLAGCAQSESAVCATQTQNYLDAVNPLIDEFLDTLDVAGSTSRIALSPIVQDMQDIRREVQEIPSPDCAKYEVAELISGMDYFIDGFLSFMSGDESVANRNLEMGDQAMARAIRALTALASGEED